MQGLITFYARPVIRNWILLYFGCLLGAVVWLTWFSLDRKPPPISLTIGVATGGLLLGGIRNWPAVALGVFSGYILMQPSRPVLPELLVTSSLTLGGVVTASIVRRVGLGDNELLDPRAVLWALSAAAAGALIAALLGTFGTTVTDAIEFGREFSDRALRYGLGMLIATPLVLVWAVRAKQGWRATHWSGFVATTVLTAGIAAWTFLRADTGPIAWLVYPPLMIVALVYHLRGAATVIAISAIIILFGTEHGGGPFALASPESRTILAQGFVVITSASTLLLAAFADKRKLDTERRVAEQRYRAVFEQRGVAVALLSLDGIYLDMNDRGLDICGYSREEIIGSDFHLLEADEDNHIRRSTAEVITGTFSGYSEDRPIRTRNGDERILNVTTNVVRDPSGHPDHLITVAKDITERVRAQDALSESEARLRLAQEAAGVGVWEIGLDDGTVHHSPESAALFGLEWRAGAYRLADFEPLLGEHQSEALRNAIVDASRDGGTLGLNLKLTESVAGERWVRLHGSYGEHHGRPRLLGLAQDVTSDFDAETKLREAHERLLRVARLSAMGAMASTLAHELNQPLAALNNYIETCRYMMKRRQDHDPDELYALNQAGEQAVRAGGIIRRIRAFTQTGEIESQRLDIPAVIESACASVQPLKLAKGVNLDRSFDATLEDVLGDPLQIEQVVANLLRNAIEATANQQDRSVRISLRAGEQETMVEIADNGPGLNDAMVSNLFEPFRTSKETGTGLGLPICRAIVEAHGGRLWAENRPSGGAVFRFTLPHVGTYELEGDVGEAR